MSPSTREPQSRRFASALQVIAASLMLSTTAAAEQPITLTDLSLEELTSLEITTASRKPQRAAEVAAALFVLSQDDIRRSGATTIPDALRLVPGLQVAQIDGNKWAITARGFNSRVASRLLVLVDGRSLYLPTYGGVYWDMQDTMIDDIERIEVVRGPGGALWGSNAFHGVINIITKHSSQTSGGLLTADAGVDDPGALSARIAGASEGAHWRVFAKAFERDANRSEHGQKLHDKWRQLRVGGRSDLAVGERSELRVSFDAHKGESGIDYFDYHDPQASTSPVPVTSPGVDQTDGAFLSSGWSSHTRSGGRLDATASVDYLARRSVVTDEHRLNLEASLQHALARSGAHALTWGFDLRRTRHTARETSYARFTPRTADLDLYSAFAQDELAFLDERLFLTIGGKLEHNDYGGTSFLPNLRARYTTETATLWAAVSQGLRTPTRNDRDSRVANFAPPLPPNSLLNPLPLPLSFELWGNTKIEPERVTAYEAGWRQALGGTLSLDVASFYHDYTRLRGLRIADPICLPTDASLTASPMCILSAAQIAIPLQYASLYEAHAYGGEVSLEWRPRSNWRLAATYSHLEQSVPRDWVELGPYRIDLNSLFYGFDPKSQYTLRSSLTLGGSWEWDVFARHIDELPSSRIPAYSELNTRIAWRPWINLEIALNGNNLLHDHHREFTSDFGDMPSVSVERSVYMQLRWSFR